MKLTTEQFNQLQQCKNTDELIAKAQAAGVEVSEERAAQLLAAAEFETLDESEADLVAGGCDNSIPIMPCKKCGSTANVIYQDYNGYKGWYVYYCSSCHLTFYYEYGAVKNYKNK